MDIKKQALKSVSWTTLATIIKQGFTMLITVVLARYLLPDDFGLVAMVLVITSFASLISDFGLGAALIQKQNVDEVDISTIFWFNASFGFVLTVLFFFLSHPIAVFYGRNEIVKINQILSPVFFIASLGALSSTMLKKELKFKEISIVEIVSLIFSGGVGVSLVFFGFGYWSLVFRFFLYQICIAIGMIFYYHHFSRKKFSFKQLRGLLKFGSFFMGAKIFSYWATKSDEVLLGKFVGGGVLGFYSNAYKIVLLPVSLIKNQIIQVFFPTISMIRNEHERIRMISVRLSSILAILGFSILFYIISMADIIVLLLLGDKWVEMIPILRLLSLSVLFEISIFPGVIFLSQGRSDLHFKLLLMTKSFSFLSMFIGVYFFGTSGLLWGLVLSSAINLYPYLVVSGKLINLPPFEILKYNYLPFMIAISSAALTFLFRQQIRMEGVIIAFLIGSMIYWSAFSTFCLVFKPRAFKEIGNLFVLFVNKIK